MHCAAGHAVFSKQGISGACMDKVLVKNTAPVFPTVRKDSKNQVSAPIRIKAKDNTIAVNISPIGFFPGGLSYFSKVRYGGYRFYLFSDHWSKQSLRGPPAV